ncbi:hypothetical protein PSPO01_01389 [Paraphaeosphaeria sporulosa]
MWGRASRLELQCSRGARGDTSRSSGALTGVLGRRSDGHGGAGRFGSGVVSSWTGTSVYARLGRACEGAGRCNSHAPRSKAAATGSGDVLVGAAIGRLQLPCDDRGAEAERRQKLRARHSHQGIGNHKEGAVRAIEGGERVKLGREEDGGRLGPAKQPGGLDGRLGVQDASRECSDAQGRLASPTSCVLQITQRRRATLDWQAPVERLPLQVLTSPRKPGAFPRIPPGPDGCVLDTLVLCDGRRGRSGEICGQLSGLPAHGPGRAGRGRDF